MRQQWVNRLKLAGFLMIPVIAVALLVDFHQRAEQVQQDYERLAGNSSIEERQVVESLFAGCKEIHDSLGLLGFLEEPIFGNCRSLFEAPLAEADLSQSDLRYADLRSADLSSADLNSADLNYANLRYANLSSADLSSADLSYADLINANLSYANLSNADLSYADLRANLSNANLTYANLTYANLINADLSYANLTYADLRSANPSNADLRSANLDGARNWIEVQLGEVKLCQTTLPEGVALDPNRDCESLGITP